MTFSTFVIIVLSMIGYAVLALAIVFARVNRLAPGRQHGVIDSDGLTEASPPDVGGSDDRLRTDQSSGTRVSRVAAVAAESPHDMELRAVSPSELVELEKQIEEFERELRARVLDQQNILLPELPNVNRRGSTNVVSIGNARPKRVANA